MSLITDYFEEIYTAALVHPAVTSVQRIRFTVDIDGQVGVYRYRIHLVNGDLLEMTERVTIESGKCVATKYRHHWQNPEGVAFPVEDPVEVGLHAIGTIDRTLYHGAFPEGTAIRFEAFEVWGK